MCRYSPFPKVALRSIAAAAGEVKEVRDVGAWLSAVTVYTT